MTDATEGRPAPVVGLAVSTRRLTFAVEFDHGGVIDRAPPIARWAIGRHWREVEAFARWRDKRAAFVWLYGDGGWSEVWR